MDHRCFTLHGGIEEADSREGGAGREKGHVVNQGIKMASESVSVGRLHPLFPGLPHYTRATFSHCPPSPTSTYTLTAVTLGRDAKEHCKASSGGSDASGASETICSVHSAASPERREAYSSQDLVREQKPGPPTPCAVHLGEFSR